MGNLKKHTKQIGRLAVLLLVAGILCCFAAKKEGYHMDELLSFELSNARYTPWIVPTQPEGRLAKFVREEIDGASFLETVENIFAVGADLVKNRGNSKLLQYKADVYPEPAWISRDEFKDYITADGSSRFNYFSVYFNVKDDNHPPLHFMLLHTMSSLFPGSMSPLLGCIINILAILGCIICFFCIGNLLEMHGILPVGYGDIYAGCAGILYGLSSGGIQTALLIRMYGLMTFFCVLFFYLHVKKWLRGEFEYKNWPLALVAVLGFLTQYFFLFYCLTLAAVTIGLLIAGKRIPELKRYICTMALAAVIGIALFPFAISDVFSSGRGVEALQNLGNGFSGYGLRLKAFGEILLQGCFGSGGIGIAALTVLVICVCVSLLTQRTKKNGKTDAAAAFSVSHTDAEKALLLLLLLPAVCYFLLAARMSPYLVDRYIMPLFPFAALLLTLLLCIAFRAFFSQGVKAKKFFCVLGGVVVVLTVLVNIVSYDGAYLYRGYEAQTQIAEQYRELPCICLYDGVGYYENLPEFAEYEKTLLLKLPELEQRQDTASLTQLQQLIVVKKKNADTKETLALFARYGWQTEELLSEAVSAHGDTVYLCSRTTKQ